MEFLICEGHNGSCGGILHCKHAGFLLNYCFFCFSLKGHFKKMVFRSSSGISLFVTSNIMSATFSRPVNAALLSCSLCQNAMCLRDTHSGTRWMCVF